MGFISTLLSLLSSFLSHSHCLFLLSPLLRYQEKPPQPINFSFLAAVKVTSLPSLLLNLPSPFLSIFFYIFFIGGWDLRSARTWRRSHWKFRHLDNLFKSKTTTKSHTVDFFAKFWDFFWITTFCWWFSIWWKFGSDFRANPRANCSSFGEVWRKGWGKGREGGNSGGGLTFFFFFLKLQGSFCSSQKPQMLWGILCGSLLWSSHCFRTEGF